MRFWKVSLLYHNSLMVEERLVTDSFWRMVREVWRLRRAHPNENIEILWRKFA